MFFVLRKYLDPYAFYSPHFHLLQKVTVEMKLIVWPSRSLVLHSLVKKHEAEIFFRSLLNSKLSTNGSL